MKQGWGLGVTTCILKLIMPQIQTSVHYITVICLLTSIAKAVGGAEEAAKAIVYVCRHSAI